MQNTYKENSSGTKPLIARKLFNAKAFGSETEKAKPLLNLPGLLIINNIYHLQVSKFVHSWHKGLLPEEFENVFQYASNIHCYKLWLNRILISRAYKLM